jgi:hypothetical protein
VARRQPDPRKKSDLATQYAEIGISAVAASVRYQGRGAVVDAVHPSRSGAERQAGSRARPVTRENKRKGRAES